MRISRGDLKPDLVLTLTHIVDGVRVPVDLTTATSVSVVAQLDGAALFDRAPVSATAAGVVTLEWQAADTDTAGWVSVEVEVTWPGAKVQTFRTDERVQILTDLG